MSEFKFSDEIVLENDRVLIAPLKPEHIGLLDPVIQKDSGVIPY